MSFTGGHVQIVKPGETCTALEGKCGSFIALVWPQDGAGATASFVISQNGSQRAIMRLTTVGDAHGNHIMLHTSWNVKILG
jgi:hypothetical protein